jgi:hypothetical protein
MFQTPNLPLAGQLSPLGQAALGESQFFSPLADAPTEFLT